MLLINMSILLYIESTNFTTFPIGGTLSFSKHMLNAFGKQLHLVGLGDEGDPIGVWFKKEINGIEFNYFSISKVSDLKKTHFTKRFVTFYYLEKFKHSIF